MCSLRLRARIRSVKLPSEKASGKDSFSAESLRDALKFFMNSEKEGGCIIHLLLIFPRFNKKKTKLGNQIWSSFLEVKIVSSVTPTHICFDFETGMSPASLRFWMYSEIQKKFFASDAYQNFEKLIIVPLCIFFLLTFQHHRICQKGFCIFFFRSTVSLQKKVERKKLVFFDFRNYFTGVRIRI